MLKKEVDFVLLNQFADWEFAPLACLINQFSDWSVKIVSLSKTPVSSIGGLSVIPDYDLTDINFNLCHGLILIGGYSWRTEQALAVKDIVLMAKKTKKIIGAICDATTFLASTGILNSVYHTGNTIQDLQSSKNYQGSSFYKNEPAVSNQKVITANGCAPLEFAQKTITALNLLNEAEAERWYNTFKHGFYKAPQDSVWWFEKVKTL